MRELQAHAAPERVADGMHAIDGKVVEQVADRGRVGTEAVVAIAVAGVAVTEEVHREDLMAEGGEAIGDIAPGVPGGAHSVDQHQGSARARTEAVGRAVAVGLVELRPGAHHSPSTCRLTYANVTYVTVGFLGMGCRGRILCSVTVSTPCGDRAARHWIDADGDGCDTREEVLLEESTTPAQAGTGCRITGGQWVSAFDGAETLDPSTFDVDHMVPLAEAWDSGASAWSASTRQAFANDLGYSGSLIAVSASSNRSKGDRDPAEWLPPNSSFRCTYVLTWIAIKYRWSLSIDPVERGTLQQQVASCGDPTLALPARAS